MYIYTLSAVIPILAVRDISREEDTKNVGSEITAQVADPREWRVP
jgi:hypothetical protein